MTIQGNATTVVPMSEMLTAADEARVLGVARSTVTRARRHPTHPVHGPNADTVTVGRDHPRAPRAQVEAWWRDRSRPLPDAPKGWSRREWAAVCDVAAGTPVTPVMREVLTGRGVLTGQGRVTAATRRLIAAHTGEAGRG